MISPSSETSGMRRRWRGGSGKPAHKEQARIYLDEDHNNDDYGDNNNNNVNEDYDYGDSFDQQPQRNTSADDERSFYDDNATGGGGGLDPDREDDIDAINASLPGLPADFSMNIGRSTKHVLTTSYGSTASSSASQPPVYLRPTVQPPSQSYQPPLPETTAPSSLRSARSPRLRGGRRSDPGRAAADAALGNICVPRNNNHHHSNDSLEIHPHDDSNSAGEKLSLSTPRPRRANPLGKLVTKKLLPLGRFVKFGGGRDNKGHKSDDDLSTDAVPCARNRGFALKKSSSFGSDVDVRERGDEGDSLRESLDGSYHEAKVSEGFPPVPTNLVTFDMSSMEGTATTATLSTGTEPVYELLDSARLAALGDITTSFVPPVHARGERARYSVYHGSGSRATKRKFRVKPHACFPEPVHMTEEEIYNDSLSTSKKFENLKSYLAPSNPKLVQKTVLPQVKQIYGTPYDDGRIGSFRMEVLGCISLPRTKPDVCVYIIAGDTPFCTDVINGFRSPMWPSASKRAATFPIHHTYARVYVGVFDVRARANKDNDVFCGRVTIDIATLRPNTDYDITFPMRASTLIYDRRARGVIRLRFSLHWFSERAAVISCFKSPQSIARRSPLVEGQPSIPCADPRTFRNVAITVHGQDFPGKYTRNAFRATMREFNLYRMNLVQLIKVAIKDAIMYETPYISLYLFFAGMYCVYCSSMHLVPALFVGYIIILYLESYKHYVAESAYNLGYKPLTIIEIAKGLLFSTAVKHAEYTFEPILVQKRTKRRRNRSMSNAKPKQSNESDVGIEPLDHREFPFSEREAYPKLAVEDALAPKTKGSRRGSTTALHGRLSVYYTATPPSMANHVEEADDDDESSNDEGDDETIMTESGDFDSMFNLDMEQDFEELEGEGGKEKEGQSGFLASTRSSVRVGPPQSNDVKGSQKIPPQVHLKRVEYMLHKLSRGISVELVHPPVELERALTETATAGKDGEVVIKKRKLPLDEFDRILGLQSRSANPVARIASSFLGPLMRIIRILTYLMRVSFNASTWRDPYMSFWILVALSVVSFILAIFPWRKFFLVVTVALFGPQNVAIRNYLEKKKARKQASEKEAEVLALEASKKEDTYGYESAEPDLAGKVSDYGYGDASPDLARKEEVRQNELATTSQHSSPHTVQAMNDGRLSFFQRTLALSRLKKAEGSVETPSDLLMEENDRPAFRSEFDSKGSGRKGLSRSVAIPYSRFRKERFYDWPPDPTVSRATPVSSVLGDHSIWLDENISSSVS